MSGVTGFIGSSLAASFLRQGKGVVAMVRNDPEGRRTREAIEKAARIEWADVTIDYSTLLHVVPFDIEMLSVADRERVLSCDEIWHSAAEMSFSSRKLESSYKMNVGGTNALYELMREGRCKRFYYISTAYTGGATTGLMEEIIHTHPHLVNPYQVTKWSAEMSLSVRSTRSPELPVTIFRPSIVIGDTRTGFYPGQPFGLYTFFSAIETIKAFGAKSLALNIDHASKAQLVPIQDLVANALSLSELDPIGRESLEIFHATGVAVDNVWLLAAVSKDTGISLSFGVPRNTLDFLADLFSQFLKKFFNNAIRFDDRKLRLALGDRYTETVLTDENIRTLYGTFKTDFAHKRQLDFTRKFGNTFGRQAHSFLRATQGLLRFVDVLGTQSMKSKIAKRILKFSV